MNVVIGCGSRQGSGRGDARFLFLPAVLGRAVKVGGSVFLGLVNGGQDCDILLLEGDDGGHDGVHLVPQFGGLGELAGRHGRFAGRSGNAVELFVFSAGVEEEAHSSGEVHLTQRGVIGTGSGSGGAGEKAESDDGNLECEKDEDIGEVKSEDFT